jgi:cell division septum initiation protein DivIVA
MAHTHEDTHIYSAVKSLEDLRRINREIRREMDAVTSQAQLTELKKRSDYLCTLAEAPSWQKKFGQKINRVKEVVREEDTKTTQHANALAKKHGWDTEYHPWGGRSG